MFTTTLQVEQQEKEKEKIRLELQEMTKESCKLMRVKQQLQQELLATNTSREAAQRQLQQQVSDMTIPLWTGLLTVDFTEEKRCSIFVIRNISDGAT